MKKIVAIFTILFCLIGSTAVFATDVGNTQGKQTNNLIEKVTKEDNETVSKLVDMKKNEEKFLGRGISTCALCDGALYKNSDVAVIGGGSSALSEALYLANIVNKVYLIHRREEFRGEDTLVRELKEKNNIELILNNEVTEIKIENNALKGIILKEGKVINIKGIFIYIGFIPNTDFLINTDIAMDNGYILVDEHHKTNIKGVYASGDVVKKDIYQIINAASEGAEAVVYMTSKIN